MALKKIKITTIILNCKKTSRALESIFLLRKQEEDSFENKIVLIDNSCNNHDRKVLRLGLKKFKNAKLIINSQNLGYSRGNNKANTELQGEFLLIMNPDILLKEKDTLKKIISYMISHPDIAVLGPKQINDDGTIAMSVRAFPKFHLQVARRTFLRNLPILKKKVAFDEMRHLDYCKIQDVDWLQSSCIMVRRDYWEKIGGFNERFFLFMADTDLCFNAWKMGYRVVYYPKARVFADGKRLSAGGIKQFFKNWVIRQHVRDSLKYHAIHFFDSNPRKNG